MYSLIIKNGLIVDGSGTKPYIGDIGINENKITAIDSQIDARAVETIDASGLVISPGFIDIQNHSDSYWSLFESPDLGSLVAQGVTTILIGQCGSSLAPLLSNDSILSVQKWHSLNGTNVDWANFKEYLQVLSNRKFGLNVASLVGYSTIRRGILGNQERALEENEIAAIKKVIEESLDAGAFGMSTGLAYSHEASVDTTELSLMAQVVEQSDGLLSIHLRNEAEQILESINEALFISKKTNVRLKISHLKIRNQELPEQTDDLLKALELAYHQGISVHFDLYPYTTAWQPIHTYLPSWVTSGGRQSMVEKLNVPDNKEKVLQSLREKKHNLEKLIISSTGNLPGMVGKSVSELSVNFGLSIEETLLEIIIKGGYESLVFDDCINQDSLNKLIEHPLSIIASDGGGFSLNKNLNNSTFGQKIVHQRCYGSFAKYLEKFSGKDEGELSSAIMKITSIPAKTAGFKNRGELRIGNFADITIFNQETIRDNSKITNPDVAPSGISYVINNGVVVLESGNLTGKLSGIVLKK